MALEPCSASPWPTSAWQVSLGYVGPRRWGPLSSQLPVEDWGLSPERDHHHFSPSHPTLYRRGYIPRKCSWGFLSPTQPPSTRWMLYSWWSGPGILRTRSPSPQLDYRVEVPSSERPTRKSRGYQHTQGFAYKAGCPFKTSRSFTASVFPSETWGSKLCLGTAAGQVNRELQSFPRLI